MKVWKFVLKPESNVERIDKHKMAVMKSKDLECLKALLDEALQEDCSDEPRSETDQE